MRLSVASKALTVDKVLCKVTQTNLATNLLPNLNDVEFCNVMSNQSDAQSDDQSDDQSDAKSDDQSDHTDVIARNIHNTNPQNKNRYQHRNEHFLIKLHQNNNYNNHNNHNNHSGKNINPGTTAKDVQREIKQVEMTQGEVRQGESSAMTIGVSVKLKTKGLSGNINCNVDGDITSPTLSNDLVALQWKHLDGKPFETLNLKFKDYANNNGKNSNNYNKKPKSGSMARPEGQNSNVTNTFSEDSMVGVTTLMTRFSTEVQVNCNADNVV